MSATTAKLTTSIRASKHHILMCLRTCSPSVCQSFAFVLQTQCFRAMQKGGNKRKRNVSCLPNCDLQMVEMKLNKTQCCWLAQTQHDGAMTFVTYNAIASSRAGCSCWLVRASGRCMLFASLGCGHLSRTDASKSLFRVPFEMKTFSLEPPFLGKSPTSHLLTPR